MELDYSIPLRFLNKYADQTYIAPDKAIANDKEKYELIKKEGQIAIDILKKIAESCEYLFDNQMVLSKKLRYLTGDNNKIRHYLWAKMKYSDYKDNPICISIFVEKKRTENAQFRISLELDLKNAKDEKDVLEKYHSHLNLSKCDDLEYVASSNEKGGIEVIDNTQNLKEGISDGKYDKVQICKIINSSDKKTNKEYEKEIQEGVEKLLPYYRYVIGMPSKQAWLLNWNPDSKIEWNWDGEYDKRCFDSKKGILFTERWTCKNQHSKIGDEFFVIKTGKEPRGVFAHGVITKNVLSSDEATEDNDHARYIDAMFDRIQNYKNEKILLQNDLKKDFPQQNWSPQASGITIVNDVLSGLREKWNTIIKENDVDLRDKNSIGQQNSVMYDKNIILFGPPGTGKTYNTTIYAVAICEGRNLAEVQREANENYEELKKRYKKLSEDGRIKFTTFHQSYGYEEFIEGIKPKTNEESSDLTYNVETGIFKSFCENAFGKQIDSKAFKIKENPSVWKVSLECSGDSPTKRDCFKNNRIRIGFKDCDQIITDESDCKSAKTKRILYDFEYSMEEGDLVVTLKDKNSIDAIGVIAGEYEWLTDGGNYPRSRKVNWIVKGINEDIRSLNNGKTLTLSTVYKLHVDAYEIIKLAQKNNTLLQDSLSGITVQDDKKPYVFIIDEINRGNISKIFGELITLIEDTKRKGMPEETSSILPYSGEEFCIPSNVYILGTMNTADRSIALMDTALRRRFQFIEMMPRVDLLENVIVEDGGKKLSIKEMLEKINKRIEFLYDREHTIGHAYFMKLKKKSDIGTLASIFEKSIIPLLQEYFYGDYNKIQLVLGDNDKEESIKFIKEDGSKDNSIFKGNPDEIADLPDVKYSINKDAFSNIESYLQI